MKNILAHLLKSQNFGSNLGRHLQTANLELHSEILANTKFLDYKSNLTFSERIYCYLNDITTEVLDAYNNPARFVNINLGYSLLTKTKTDNKKPGPKRTKAEVNVSTRATNLDTAKLANSTDEKLGAKLRKHIRQWPNNSGKPLYANNKVEGIDYLICPITQLRKTSIRTNYTENILGMTMEQYLDIVGEDFELICSGHKNVLSKSLKELDEETGLTKHQLSVKKAQEKLNKVDIETGKTGHNLRTAKTVQTHKDKIDENGLNGFQRIGAKATVKGNTTKRIKGIITSEENKPAFAHYKNLVHWLTKQNNAHLDLSKSGLAGTEGATHIDHIYSVFNGFNDSVSPFLIGHSANLRTLPWKDNVVKNTKNDITLDELFEKSGYTRDKNTQEFLIIMELINNTTNAELSAGLLFEGFRAKTKLLQE